MKPRDFHQQVRVIYRACRRLYGVEKTQDECLRVFKVVYPEILRLKSSDNEREQLSENIRYDIQRIVKSWHPQKQLRIITERIDDLIALPFDHDRLALITFLEDITPVAMRIRKLTPRECFRLMGLSEEEIDTIQSTAISKSAQYKLAGNSIVVDVLYHIFRTLFIDTAPTAPKGTPIQLTFF